MISAGYLDFPDIDRDEVLGGFADTTQLSRQDTGCIDYRWAEDTRHPSRFRFFEA